MSNPRRASIYLIETRYAIINHKIYRLEELDDEGVAEVLNGGDAIPLISATGGEKP